MGELAAGRGAAGVVDEDVEPAERLEGAGDDLGGRVGIHQIGRDVDEITGQCVELG